jgi:hypothetical protein
MGEVKLIVLFSKKIVPPPQSHLDVRIISEECYDHFPESVLVANTNENISQKWS